MVARIRQTTAAAAVIGLQGLLLLSLLSGCETDECVSCVDAPPLAPTQVYSVSGDSRITVYWTDYPEIYSGDITGYRVWSRIFENGDEMTEEISRLQRDVSERSPDRLDRARIPKNRSGESPGAPEPAPSCRAQPLSDDRRTWHGKFQPVEGPEALRLVLDHPCWEASVWDVRGTT